MDKILLTVYGDIKQQAFSTPGGNIITYTLDRSKLPVGMTISLEDFSQAIYLLQEKGAIKVLEERRVYRGVSEWRIELLKPRFDKLLDELLGSNFVPIGVLPLLNGRPDNWKWFDREAGQYQFGEKQFTQAGKTRKKVFQSLMDIFEKSQSISVATLAEETQLPPSRVRIEIAGISGRLSKKVGFYFKGSGQGFYTLEQSPKSSKTS